MPLLFLLLFILLFLVILLMAGVGLFPAFFIKLNIALMELLDFSNPVVRGVIGAVVLATFVPLIVLFITWMERRVVARFQVRYGPNRVGKFGLLQPVADMIKLLTKESITPEKADKFVFNIAPVFIFVPPFLMLVPIPFSSGLVVSDLNIGILYVVAVSSLSTIGIVMAGWGPNNKYNLIGGLRSTAQMMSYEIPLVLSVIGVVMLAKSLSLVSIVQAQSSMWFVFIQPVGFVVYMISMLAESFRHPFDLTEAESELVSGWTTEFGGMRFAMFMLAEYMHLFIGSILAVVLFFGGWNGPFLPPIVWFLIKTFAIIFFLMWVRFTYPRIRIDHLLDMGWKLLIPLALLNIGLTGGILIALR